MKKLKVKLTFTESLLGTSPADAEIYSRFIGAKSPDALTVDEEVAALGADEITERGTTVSPERRTASRFCTTTRSRASSRMPARCWHA